MKYKTAPGWPPGALAAALRGGLRGFAPQAERLLSPWCPVSLDSHYW